MLNLNKFRHTTSERSGTFFGPVSFHSGYDVDATVLSKDRCDLAEDGPVMSHEQVRTYQLILRF